MTAYETLKLTLVSNPKTWLITGVGGFIGSSLLETLLKLNQRVVGLDNFCTGYKHNLEEVQTLVNPGQWNNFHFIKGDIRNLDDCKVACNGVDYVLHQAALGSVPRSIKDPISTNQNNIDGYLNILVSARDANVKRFVYAASSSTYGDYPDLPKVEDKIGKPLSPYALTKLVNELYANLFAETYSFKTIGLRYFNIFGKRQDTNGVYAAVIPKWTDAMTKNQTIYINGDGETSRDFCYINNAVQANLLAATVDDDSATNQIYNVAVGNRITLNQLFEAIRQTLEANGMAYERAPVFCDFRAGDVRHSVADIKKAKQLLGYEPSHNFYEGLTEAIKWYLKEQRL